MIKRIWKNKIPYWLIPLILIPSVLYFFIITLIRINYKYGFFKKSWKSPIPVIIIGNITVGGNGKTPLVIWLVKKLQKFGIKPGVVSRGYGSKSKHYPLLVNKDTSVICAGDESLLIACHTKAPIAISPNRRDAIELLISNYILDVIIMDDGLQNYSIERDVEIVVIDKNYKFGNGWLLPFGPMRETVRRLKKVDAVIMNGENANFSEEISMFLKPCKAVNLCTGIKLDLNKFTEVIAIAGIGHPSRFFATLKNNGLNLLNAISFRDHHNFTYTELNALLKKNEILFMTEKDGVKCRSFAKFNWWYLPVEASLYGDKLSILLAKIISCCLK